MDKVTLIMFIGLSGFIFFLFFYILNRDKTNDRKFAAMELMIENLNQELFKLNKEVKNIKKMDSLDEIENIIEGMIANIKNMQRNFNLKIQELEEKIDMRETSQKKAFDFTNVNMNDEKKIKALYKSGYSLEEISRELRIPVGEIKLILNFSGLE